MNKLAILVASVILVACASPKQENKQSNESAKPSAPAVAVTATSAVSPEAAAAAKLNAELQKQRNESVYFGYNEYTINPAFRKAIEKQADNMKHNKKESLVLAGNADERGSEAYNMALGEKRAASVKKVLAKLGVSASRIKLISYGKSKPELTCHEEKCWHENRRVDFSIAQK